VAKYSQKVLLKLISLHQSSLSSEALYHFMGITSRDKGRSCEQAYNLQYGYF